MKLIKQSVERFGDLVEQTSESELCLVYFVDDVSEAESIDSSIGVNIPYKSFIILGEAKVAGIEMPKQKPVALAYKGYSYIGAVTIGVESENFGEYVTHLA